MARAVVSKQRADRFAQAKAVPRTADSGFIANDYKTDACKLDRALKVLELDPNKVEADALRRVAKPNQVGLDQN